MTPAQILAWVQAAQLLIGAGVATAQTLKGIFNGAGLTEDEQNAILDGIIQRAGTRKRRSQAIVDGG